MGRLDDPDIRARYFQALSLWQCSGYITWKWRAREFVQQELEGLTPTLVGKLMFEYVQSGGEIDRCEEGRTQWLEWKYHYDLRIPICGRLMYIETVIIDDDPDDWTITVVNMHYA